MKNTQATNPVVFVSDGKVTTTSLNVAAVFGKEHKNILQAVNNLEIPEDFGRLNFKQSSYINDQNKKQPMIEMTRDGFTFLVMGFTGIKAAEFKLKYIAEFNKMEEVLLNDIPKLKKKKDVDTTEIAKEFKAFKSIALTAGLKGNFAVLSANQAMIRHYGSNPLKMIESTHLESEVQEPHLTVSDIAARIGGISSQGVNKILTDMGFQIKHRTSRGRVYYEPTEKGKNFSVLLNVGKTQFERTTITQLKWRAGIIEQITPDTTKKTK